MFRFTYIVAVSADGCWLGWSGTAMSCFVSRVPTSWSLGGIEIARWDRIGRRLTWGCVCGLVACLRVRKGFFYVRKYRMAQPPFFRRGPEERQGRGLTFARLVLLSADSFLLVFFSRTGILFGRCSSRSIAIRHSASDY